MSHEINELAPGIFSFVDSRTDAWHQLGVSLDGVFDADTALETAKLKGWDVRKTEIQTVEGAIAIDNRWATIYTNPITKEIQYLGVVGSHYTPIQNETHVDLLDAIVDESGAHFETAGSLRGGRETFVSMKVPSTMNIGGIDPVDLYLVALNSHDGTSSFRFIITPVRVVCANTQAAALKEAKASFSIRHVKGAQGHIQEAREALGLTFAYVDEFSVAAEQMIQQEITDKAFEKIVGRLFDADLAKTTRQQSTAAEHIAGVMSLWKGDSVTMQNVKGTRWGGYQAVTEYTDHFMSVRSTGMSSIDVARASRAATSKPMQTLKENAFTLLSK
jgi:phage/plasmid-like protein (TIGR03299 family)